MTLVIFLLIGFVFLPAFAQEDPSIHFHGDVQAWSSNGDNIFGQGDSILLSGWSGAYQDWGGVFVTPDSEFWITILDPDGLDFFKESIISDSQGNMERVVELPADAKVGRYQIFVEIFNGEYGEFGTDHRFLYVSPHPHPHPHPPPHPPPSPKDYGVEQNYKIDTLPYEPTAQFGDFASMPWTVCPQIDPSTLKEFADVQTRSIVKEGQALIIYKIVSPSGIVVEEPNDHTVECGYEYNAGFRAVEPGIWTVNIMLRWYDGQSVREISGDAMEITVIEPVFSGSEIESISVPIENLERAVLLDWSPDGERIAMYYTVEGHSTRTSFLGLMNAADGQNTSELWEIDPEEDVGTVKFSPDGGYLFAIVEDSLVRYSTDTSELHVMYDGEYPIQHFDFLSSSAGDFDLMVSLDNYSLLEILGDTRRHSLVNLGPLDSLVSDVRAGEIVVSDFESSYFDLNSDGSRTLFVRTLDSGHGWADRTLAYLDAKGTVYELGRDPGCGRSPVWSPGETLIIYEDTYCGRGPSGGSVYITSDDGSFFEVLLPHSNHRLSHFIISPDGQYIMYPTEGQGNFLKMKFAKSVPEFGVLGILIVAFAIITAVAVSRAKPGKLYS